MASSSEQTLFPIDLVEEILYEIPIEYLIRFQLVCKQWHSLFKNQPFIYRYSDLVQERFIRIDRAVQIIDPVTQTRLISPLPDELHERPSISTFVHCDGLVLLKFNSRQVKDHRKLAIWNPILGKIKWIQPFLHYWYNDTYGIGYNNVCRGDYKIFRFFNRIYDSDSARRESYGINLEIYDLKSNLWSSVDVSLDWSRDPPCKGVSVNGNMYWTAHWNNTNPKMFIQSFDFSTQTFKPRTGLPFESFILDTIALSCFRRDKLSLLHQIAKTKEIEVWVSNKVDDEVMSWSKYLSVASPDMPTLQADQNLINPSYFIDKNDKIRIWCEEESEDESDDDRRNFCVSVYEISKDGIKKEIETGRFGSYGGYDTPVLCGYVYVPSLVPIPEQENDLPKTNL